MNKYNFEITETLQIQVEIIAHSKEDALIQLKQLYKNEDIVLDSSNYVETEFTSLDEGKALSKVEELRYLYPEGTRLECLSMSDPFHPIPSGTRVSVSHIDDAGTIHMQWDNGSSLGLILGEDAFKKVNEPIKKKTQTHER